MYGNPSLPSQASWFVSGEAAYEMTTTPWEMGSRRVGSGHIPRALEILVESEAGPAPWLRRLVNHSLNVGIQEQLRGSAVMPLSISAPWKGTWRRGTSAEADGKQGDAGSCNP